MLSTDNVIIDVKDVKFRYYGKKTFALNGISLKIKKGEFFGITGPNGAGKTTLSLCLDGLIPHIVEGKFYGDVIVDGMNTKEHSVSEMALKVGLVFQNPKAQLSGSALTVEEEVAFGVQNLGVPREELLKRVKEAIEIVGLSGLEPRSPFTLSGGQTQRLAIATVLAMRTKILVMDEVTSQLDPVGTFEVTKTTYKLHKEYGLTVVFISNKSELLAMLADRIVVMNQGEIVAIGSPKEIYNKIDFLEEIGVVPIPVTKLGKILDERDNWGKPYPITDEEAIDFIKKHIS